MLTSSKAFIRQANRFAALSCPVLHFPEDGSTLVRVAPMPLNLRRIAEKVALRREGYYNAATMVFRNPSPDLRYVVGLVDLPRPVEHVWVKLGESHYDPTWELFGSTEADYLPVFELDEVALTLEMTESGSGLPPDLSDLIRWQQSRQRRREKQAANQAVDEAEGDHPQEIFLHNGVAL